MQQRMKRDDARPAQKPAQRLPVRVRPFVVHVDASGMVTRANPHHAA